MCVKEALITDVVCASILSIAMITELTIRGRMHQHLFHFHGNEQEQKINREGNREAHPNQKPPRARQTKAQVNCGRAGARSRP